MRYTSILATVFLLAASLGFSQDTGTDTVKVPAGNIRKEPNTDAPIILRVYRGDTLTISGQEGKWLFIKLPDGRNGWAHQTLFDAPSKEIPERSVQQGAAETFRATLTEPGGNVREFPSLDAPVIWVLKKGETVTVFDRERNWYRVKLEDGTIGWAHISLFSPPSKIPAPENKRVREITSIQAVVFSETEEKVLFTLSGFFPPKTSTVSGKIPQVVCDFIGAMPGAEISGAIRGEGKFIQQITVETDDNGTRVFILLSPEHDYNIHQVFFEKEKIYSLIFKKM